MLFQHTVNEVLCGRKTQTRRRIQPPAKTGIGQAYKGETFLEAEYQWDIMDKPFPGVGVYIIEGVEGGWVNGTVCFEPEWFFTKKWVVGCDYAVQPGRGQKQVARIRIDAIRKEDVRNISHEDAIAEGFDHAFEFLSKWSEINHLKFKFYFDPQIVDYRVWYNRQWQTMSYEHVKRILMEQPAQYYQAWVLEFSLLQHTVAQP